MDYAKLSKCWRETVYGNNITLCGGKDPLHRVFYLHKSNMCAMIRKRTYVLIKNRKGNSNEKGCFSKLSDLSV